MCTHLIFQYSLYNVFWCVLYTLWKITSSSESIYENTIMDIGNHVHAIDIQ